MSPSPCALPRSRRRWARGLTTGAALAAVAVTLAACDGAAEPTGTADAGEAAGIQLVDTTEPATGDLAEAAWMMSKEPVSLDFDNDGANSQTNLIMANVCERLSTLEPDLSIGPGLASSFEWTDDTHLVFTLRDDVTFHSGAVMTADDVVWSLQRHAAPEGAESDEFANVTGIEQTGEWEVTLTTTQPDAVLAQALAGNAGVVYERAVVEQQGEAFGGPAGIDACSGPFALDSWRPGEQIVLAKAADYWNPERAARTDRLTFTWGAPDAILNSLVTGAVQGSYLEDLSLATQLGTGGTTVAQGPDTRVWSLMITERGALADPRLRQALSLALNREGVNQAAFAGLGRPWNEPVGSGAWGYEPDVFQAAHDELPYGPAEPSETDIDRAKELVGEVGETDEILVASDGSSVRNAMASALVDAATAIGLNAKLVQIPTAQYGDFYSSPELRQEADVFSDDYYVSKFDPVGFYKNGASDATVQWLLDDPEYDQLVADARAATDDAERAEIANDLAARWAEAMPWISAVESPSTVALADDVTGVPASGAYRYYPWAADLGSRD